MPLRILIAFALMLSPVMTLAKELAGVTLPETITLGSKRKGDVIRLDYLPGTGTTVSINNETRGVIEGEDFRQAWLRIWLGKEPAGGGLKQELLGAD